ncbi:hypothetical protein E1287_13960 [Actinomadura sp. KC06]|uniref:hypothetical protein n=1 Tax=Actinomadura sp. KC06 TaxID=2530369 RepID=UPI001045D0D7|nr:hypothetical protein [Actinomadura sp. KC06]TDD35384.1 hypothetical protein E1287_13960 [Actinomadura sp. KC06]
MSPRTSYTGGRRAGGDPSIEGAAGHLRQACGLVEVGQLRQLTIRVEAHAAIVLPVRLILQS